MAARSIASLSLSFGLVSIPVKLYSATESSAGVRFNMVAKDGSRLKQQYVNERTGEVVERAEIVKGYEFEKDRFVLFSSDELKALQEARSPTIDIVAFLPENSVDPIYYDKAYFLAPDKRGGKPYSLLLAAMKESGRCALAKWAWRGKQTMVQVRPADDGLILQQLLYADEVRSLKDLDIESAPVTQGELKLALQFIEQIAEENYEPAAYEDEERKRILEAIDRKIAGSEIVVQDEEEPAAGAQVIDLMAALKASLGARGGARKAKETPADADAGGRRAATVPAAAAAPAAGRAKKAATPAPTPAATERKGVRRAAKAAEADVAAPAPQRLRARK
jgi:DNA end-binding protein Ku